MKYRQIIDLTDAEVTDIISRLFHPNSTELINRRDISFEQSIVVRFRDEYDDLCKVTMYDPYADEGLGLFSKDYEISWQRNKLYKQFCLSKGVCIDLKDNPFIEDKNV